MESNNNGGEIYFSLFFPMIFRGLSLCWIVKVERVSMLVVCVSHPSPTQLKLGSSQNTLLSKEVMFRFGPIEYLNKASPFTCFLVHPWYISCSSLFGTC